MWTIVLFSGLLVPAVLGQSCTQTLEVGIEYYTNPTTFTSPRTPQYGTKCKWLLNAPPGYRVQLDCTVEIPLGLLTGRRGCFSDTLLVSPTGRSDLSDAFEYCDTIPISVRSNGSSMAVGLKGQLISIRGIYHCSAYAVFDPCDCGKKINSRIVGGTDASIDEFPAQVSIFNPARRGAPCEGVIISSWKILTSVWCVKDFQVNHITARTAYYTKNIKEKNQYSKSYIIKSVICIYGTCNYDPTFQRDIVIATPKDEIIFNAGVQPACLPFYYDFEDFAGTKVQVAGWGLMNPNGTYNDVKRMQKTTLDVISNEECEKMLTNPILSDSEMCLWTEGTNTCMADCGAGLFYTGDNGRLYTIGISTTLRSDSNCTSQPSINTRLTDYLMWIEENAFLEGEYCRVHK